MITAPSILEFVFGKIADLYRPGDLGTSGVYDDGNNFVDYEGNRKYFSPAKMAAWQTTEEQILHILTGADWADQLSHNYFRRKNNGKKIEEVFRLIQENYPGALQGFGVSVGGDSFSYKDFYYPGIDMHHLGDGSESLFDIWISNIDLRCVLTSVGSLAAATAVSVASGGTLSIPAFAVSAAESARVCVMR